MKRSANCVGVHLTRLEDRCVPAIFLVNTNADTADANPGDGRALDGNNKTSLRAAVQEANALRANGGDASTIIQFNQAMTITLTAAMDSFTANIAVDYVVQTAGTDGGPPPPPEPVVIQGNGTFRLFDIQPGSVSSFSGPFQMCGGAAPGSGGGAFINWGSLALSDCDIFNNSESGIDNLGAMDIASCQIYSNTGGSGAGLSCSAKSTTTIDYGTQIYDNTASGSGGGIFVSCTIGDANSGAIVDVWNSEIYANTAGDNGGGVYNSGTFTMHNGSVYLNFARGHVDQGQQRDGKGGGLYNAFDNPKQAGQMTLVGVTIERNTATVMGGAMYLESGTNTGLENCILQNDTSGTGNGPGIARGQTATLEMNGCVYNDGGGTIYID